MDLKEEGQQLSGGCRACLAIPGRFIEVSPQDPNSAVVEAFGIRRQVDVTLIQDDKPAPGEWVLIHVGFAMSKISETDAMDRLRTLELLGETQAAAQEICSYDLADENNAPSVK
ncbi:MAG: HypC/HybG/HupF family hydrogenase formation chaperone [Candidatus Acidiferrales bacterium]